LSGGGIPQTTTGTCNQQMDCVCQNGKSRSVTCLVHQPEGFLYFDVHAAEFLKKYFLNPKYSIWVYERTVWLHWGIFF